MLLRGFVAMVVWAGLLSTTLASPGKSDDVLHVVAREQVDMSIDAMDLVPGVEERMAGFKELVPRVGEAMPPIVLPDVDGRTRSLADHLGHRPVLLVSGSASCPVYRRTVMLTLEEMRRQYGDDLAIYVLYTTEAHPAIGKSLYVHGQWITQANYDDELFVRQPDTLDERVALASALAARFGLSREHLLIDAMDNAVWTMLGGMPNSALLIDAEGRVVFKEAWARQERDASGRPVLDDEIAALVRGQ